MKIKYLILELPDIKLHIYDLSYFKGRKYFDEGDGKQNYLVFLPMRKYFKLSSVAGVIDRVLSWQSKGISKVLNHLQHLIMVLIQN